MISSIWHSVSSPDETPHSSSKYSTVRHIFNSLLSVSSGDETLRPMLDIYSHHACVFDCEFAKMWKWLCIVLHLQIMQATGEIPLQGCFLVSPCAEYTKKEVFYYFILSFLWGPVFQAHVTMVKGNLLLVTWVSPYCITLYQTFSHHPNHPHS